MQQLDSPNSSLTKKPSTCYFKIILFSPFLIPDRLYFPVKTVFLFLSGGVSRSVSCPISYLNELFKAYHFLCFSSVFNSEVCDKAISKEFPLSQMTVTLVTTRLFLQDFSCNSWKRPGPEEERPAVNLASCREQQGEASTARRLRPPSKPRRRSGAAGRPEPPPPACRNSGTPGASTSPPVPGSSILRPGATRRQPRSAAEAKQTGRRCLGPNDRFPLRSGGRGEAGARHRGPPPGQRGGSRTRAIEGRGPELRR